MTGIVYALTNGGCTLAEVEELNADEALKACLGVKRFPDESSVPDAAAGGDSGSSLGAVLPACARATGCHSRSGSEPETLATAIRIGDPISWPKALHEVRCSNGVVEQVTEQEIADAKAQIGLCGIGCEPASAATLAGIRKLRAAGVIGAGQDVVAVLTGNLLNPDYIYRYHTGQLKAPDGATIEPTFGNRPTVVPNDPDRIARYF